MKLPLILAAACLALTGWATSPKQVVNHPMQIQRTYYVERTQAGVEREEIAAAIEDAQADQDEAVEEIFERLPVELVAKWGPQYRAARAGVDRAVQRLRSAGFDQVEER